MKPERWTKADDFWLVQLWPTHETWQVADELGRTPDAVRCRAQILRRYGDEATRCALENKKSGPRRGERRAPQRDPVNRAPDGSMRIIEDGYPDVPWHIRISHRDQRTGYVR